MLINLPSNINKTHRLFLIAAFSLFIILAFIISLHYEDANLSLNDNLFKLRYFLFGKQVQYDDLLIYNLTDTDLTQKKLFPSLTQFLNSMNKGNTKTVLFDIIIQSQGNPEESKAMLNEIIAGKNIFLPAVPDLSKNHSLELKNWSIKKSDNQNQTADNNAINWVVKPFPALIEAAKGIGAIVQLPGYQGIIRKINLVYPYNGEYLPSLLLQALIHYLDINYSDIIINPGSDISLTRTVNGINHKLAIPIDSEGRMMINYSGPWEDSLRSYSINQLPANSKLLYNFFNNTIVFLGDNTTSAKDWSRGMFGEDIYPNSGAMGNALNTILTEKFLYNNNFLFYLFIPFIMGILAYLLLIHNYRPFLIINITMLVFLPVYQFIIFLFGILPNHLFILFILLIQVFLFILAKPENKSVTTNIESDIQFSPEHLHRVLKSKLQFTEKQIDVVLPLLEGKQYKEISNILNISVTSTRTRIHKLYQKVGVSNKIEFSNFIREAVTEE